MTEETLQFLCRRAAADLGQAKAEVQAATTDMLDAQDRQSAVAALEHLAVARRVEFEAIILFDRAHFELDWHRRELS